MADAAPFGQSGIDCTIDRGQAATAFPHYWERCVGSGHAYMGLREDWRVHLRACREELGFAYIRFHGLLNEYMSVYKQWSDYDNYFEYSFYNIDNVFDFVLSIGMKPFIEISFMPDSLASGTSTIFHYKANTTPPKSYADWDSLIAHLVRHLLDRYGSAEVESWFFEVWNEPNLQGFWSGTRDDYFKLYCHTARTIKRLNSALRVGGPATARNEWIPEFLSYCRTNAVPVDFVSTHHYPTDSALGHGPGATQASRLGASSILKDMVKKALSEAGQLPLYYTEWNSSPNCRDAAHDDPSAAAFVASTIINNAGLVDIYSYWTFTDLFEENGLCSIPFHGGFGLLSTYGTRKPSFRAFELLHRLGDRRLSVNVGGASASHLACVATESDEEIAFLICNPAHHTHDGPGVDVSLTITNMSRRSEAHVCRIDEDNANPKRVWERLGAPTYPSESELMEIENGSRLVEYPVEIQHHGSSAFISFTIPRDGLLFLSVRGGAGHA